MYDDEIKECMLSVRISELLFNLNCIIVVKRQVHFITTEIFGPNWKESTFCIAVYLVAWWKSVTLTTNNRRFKSYQTLFFLLQYYVNFNKM